MRALWKELSLPAPESGPEPVRVLLADDHTLFRQGLARVLASYGGLEVVGEVPNDEEVVALVEKVRPDVVIMQVQLPPERARKTLERLRGIEPPPRVVVVTMLESPRTMRDMLDFGTSAYLLKSASAAELVGAVRAAVFDPKGEQVVVGMPRELLEEARDGSGGVLSARELEVLLLAGRGLSNRRIAERLHLSEATVKRHLANVYPKMGVSSRGEAVRQALGNEWITIQEVTE
jgi:DNA-binding NarL/FixJ family response regulator